MDAFALRSWDNSSCPGCKRWHRECGLYQVPDGLADTVVRRARSDGARGLFPVPTDFKAGYFIALRSEAIAVLELVTNQSLYSFTSKPVGRMTLFAADFCDKEADCLVPACAHAFEPRIGRRPSRGESEADEAIQVKLRHLASTI